MAKDYITKVFKKLSEKHVPGSHGAFFVPRFASKKLFQKKKMLLKDVNIKIWCPPPKKIPNSLIT